MLILDFAWCLSFKGKHWKAEEPGDARGWSVEGEILVGRWRHRPALWVQPRKQKGPVVRRPTHRWSGVRPLDLCRRVRQKRAEAPDFSRGSFHEGITLAWVLDNAVTFTETGAVIALSETDQVTLNGVTSLTTADFAWM